MPKFRVLETHFRAGDSSANHDSAVRKAAAGVREPLRANFSQSVYCRVE
jgi:hypothetical protein